MFPFTATVPQPNSGSAVIQDAAQMIQQHRCQRFPHVHTGGGDPHLLTGSQFILEELVQRLFLRSRPNYTGSPLLRLLTTVMNFYFFPR
jgi:hypothetical protein